MSKMRGHMRRRKARLTTQSLSAVMEMGRPTAAAEPPSEVAASLDLGDFNILELLRREDATVSMPAAYNDAGSVFSGAPGVPTDRFVFGLLMCPECRNEIIYYQTRDVLEAGYQFRCRICQHPLLATLP